MRDAMIKTKICGVEITNPDRVIFNKLGITKLDVAKYYETVASLMLPYVSNRLLSVIRCHDGVSDSCFIRKHESNTNPAIKKLKVGDNEEFFYITNKTGLITEVQLGTLEFHPWGSTAKTVDKPDIMIFDLDPDEKLPLSALQQGVLHIKEVLDELSVKAFLKTSGGKGYHIVVPFRQSGNWENFSNFAKKVAMLMETRYPKLYTTNIRKIKRKGKIFVDALRNTRGATCVCPYSLRARETASISMPISWQDLDKIAPNEITLQNYKKHLKQNPWKDFFTTDQKLK